MRCSEGISVMEEEEKMDVVRVINYDHGGGGIRGRCCGGNMIKDEANDERFVMSWGEYIRSKGEGKPEVFFRWWKRGGVGGEAREAGPAGRTTTTTTTGMV